MNLKISPLSFKSHLLISNNEETKNALMSAKSWPMDSKHSIAEDLKSIQTNGDVNDVFIYKDTRAGVLMMKLAENNNDGLRYIIKREIINGDVIGTYGALKNKQGATHIFFIDKKPENAIYQYLI